MWLPFLNNVYFEARTNQAENVKQHWIYEECHVFKAQLAFETPSLQLKEGRTPPAFNSFCKNEQRIIKSSEANHTHPDTSSETSESHSIYVTPQQDQRQLLNPRLNVHKIGLPTQKVCLMINSDLNLITNKIISKKIQHNCGLNFRLSCNMCWALLQMPSYPKCSHGTATSIRVPSRPRICKCTVSESSELQESLTDIDIFGPESFQRQRDSELSTLAPRCKKAWKISARWSTQSTNTILRWSS